MAGARATFQRIAVALIDVPEDRLSAVRAARVETIAKTSRAIGLLQPVNVEALKNGRFRLIAGAKRLAALMKAGEAEIDARVIAAGTLDEAGRRLIEIVENLDRHDLTKLERAEHLVALKSAHEARFPEARRGGRRGNQHSGGMVRQSEIFAFSQEAAEMTGLSRRAIEVAVQIVSALSEDSKVRLCGNWLEDHQAGLKLLSEQKPAVQARILDILFASPPEAASVADALALVEGRRLLTTAEKLFASTLGNWSRLSERQRSAFLDTHEAAIRVHARARGWFR
ncbi:MULTISPECIES: ParB/RepB/Spo0J family partition protein [Phyllobacteriaceae]|jgi:ParB family transcriptional regulator, chromosome partitioning protein|uniref:ParB-like N-terminal domain-containing protein n=1 Tax=Mesorhizobium hungaricum TaxID=1566387 RepID=A0A1C2DRY5_9HYPH|nr:MULTISPECIES: ParB N-terminal domain-containing protein [Mesorhizobium]MBN9236104.1 ParB N-terminal domain-containing protein [Mesorhizobium sp.]MDQ0328064.1 ParB family chromosome partitioning protein [Mesorhizobium sp. YL-MeA3-2017]OCX17541.1 hypothetical protein QV13_12330 [Mesorhizobium hungaricum]